MKIKYSPLYRSAKSLGNPNESLKGGESHQPAAGRQPFLSLPFAGTGESSILVILRTPPARDYR